MNRLYLYLGAGVAALALAVTLFFLIGANASKAAMIKQQKSQLVAAALSLAQAAKDIKRFAAAEGISRAEVADLCRADQNGAFDRGVQVGQAIEAARDKPCTPA